MHPLDILSIESQRPVSPKLPDEASWDAICIWYLVQVAIGSYALWLLGDSDRFKPSSGAHQYLVLYARVLHEPDREEEYVTNWHKRIGHGFGSTSLHSMHRLSVRPDALITEERRQQCS